MRTDLDKYSALAAPQFSARPSSFEPPMTELSNNLGSNYAAEGTVGGRATPREFDGSRQAGE